jgi:hypothetical protein
MGNVDNLLMTAFLENKSLSEGPYTELQVHRGRTRPITYSKRGHADVRTVSASFLASFNELWEERGAEILDKVADEHPELVMMCMVKLAQVQRVSSGHQPTPCRPNTSAAAACRSAAPRSH